MVGPVEKSPGWNGLFIIITIISFIFIIIIINPIIIIAVIIIIIIIAIPFDFIIEWFLFCLC